ncbi:MAG: hypothetical protein ACYCW6_21090 [Candidatus Xenobia bacterium]
MPQLHLYLPGPLAEEVKRRAETKGVSVSAWLADVVRSQLGDAWPPGYLEDVIGCTREDPLSRPDQGDFETRDPL